MEKEQFLDQKLGGEHVYNSPQKRNKFPQDRKGGRGQRNWRLVETRNWRPVPLGHSREEVAAFPFLGRWKFSGIISDYCPVFTEW